MKIAAHQKMALVVMKRKVVVGKIENQKMKPWILMNLHPRSMTKYIIQ